MCIYLCMSTHTYKKYTYIHMYVYVGVHLPWSFPPTTCCFHKHLHQYSAPSSPLHPPPVSALRQVSVNWGPHGTCLSPWHLSPSGQTPSQASDHATVTPSLKAPSALGSWQVASRHWWWWWWWWVCRGQRQKKPNKGSLPELKSTGSEIIFIPSRLVTFTVWLDIDSKSFRSEMLFNGFLFFKSFPGLTQKRPWLRIKTLKYINLLQDKSIAIMADTVWCPNLYFLIKTWCSSVSVQRPLRGIRKHEQHKRLKCHRCPWRPLRVGVARNLAETWSTPHCVELAP